MFVLPLSLMAQVQWRLGGALGVNFTTLEIENQDSSRSFLFENSTNWVPQLMVEMQPTENWNTRLMIGYQTYGFSALDSVTNGVALLKNRLNYLQFSFGGGYRFGESPFSIGVLLHYNVFQGKQEPYFERIVEEDIRSFGSFEFNAGIRQRHEKVEFGANLYTQSAIDFLMNSEQHDGTITLNLPTYFGLRVYLLFGLND